MGIPVLILGESGTGKSASLRNFKRDDLKVINVANKPLPFKNKFESIATDDYRTIIKELKLNKKNVSVIDDAQYLMANEFMRRATERGYDKFTEIAQNFWNLVNCVKDLPSNHIVYFMAHIERDQNGNEKIKTIGKLLDEKITVEGMFTIVLKTNVTDGQYSFLTQNSGHDTVKSPIGMFPSYAIDNDLKYVDEKIRNYYELGEFLTDEEMKEIDEMVKKDDIPIADEKPKRGRRSAKKEESAKAPEKEEKAEAAESEEKPTRRRRSQENTDNDNEPAGAEEPAMDIDKTDEPAEQPRRRRRVSDDMAEERAAVKEENAKTVANAGIEEAGEKEEVPFDETETPELKEQPRRKRRGTTATEEPPMNKPKEPEEQATEEAAPRRRRRRG